MYLTKRQWLGSSLSSLATAALGVILCWNPVDNTLALKSYDLPFLFRSDLKVEEAVIVYMDDTSHQELQQILGATWDRSLHARLLDRLTAEKARAVVFDIVFDRPSTDAASDKLLARALQVNGQVILAAEELPQQLGPGIINAWKLVLPLKEFRRAAAGYGLAGFQIDQPGYVIRLQYPGTADLPSLAGAAAQWVQSRSPPKAETGGGERWFNYYGPPGAIPSVSYYRALQANEVPPGFFRNKVVFVGAYPTTGYAGEARDAFNTPYTLGKFPGSPGVKSTLSSGAEIHATALVNRLRGDWQRRLSRSFECLILGIIGVFLGFGLVPMRQWTAVGLSLLGALLTPILGCALVWKTGYWFPWLIIVAVQIPAAWAMANLYNALNHYIDKCLLEQTLALYLSPQLVRKMARRPGVIRPGAEKQTLTILFSDVAGFTSMSEGLDSDELARLLNRYFEMAVSHCIHATDGTVVKYIGDSIFAFWNAPDPQPDHALRACRAALRFRDLETQYIQGQPVRTRIGLHTGVANVGNFGSAKRVDYTAIGENVNLASRLEGLNKYLGTAVLATADTYSLVHDQLPGRCVGKFRLKGFEKAVEVYELMDRPESDELSPPGHEAFAAALRQFQQRDFLAAEPGFRLALEWHPADGPAQFYLEQIAAHRLHPPPRDWRGEVDMKEK